MKKKKNYILGLFFISSMSYVHGYTNSLITQNESSHPSIPNFPYGFCNECDSSSTQSQEAFLNELDEIDQTDCIANTTPKKSIEDLNSDFFYFDKTIQHLQCKVSLPTVNCSCRTIAKTDQSAFLNFLTTHSITKFLGNNENQEVIESFFNRILQRVITNNPMAWLAVIDNDTQQVIGFAGLGIPFNGEPGAGELIVFFDTIAQKKGVGTALLSLCLSKIAPEIQQLGVDGFPEFCCFQGEALNTIYATVHTDNEAALKILLRSSMKPAIRAEYEIIHFNDSIDLAKLPNSNKYIFEYTIPIVSSEK
jgi:RimJ/RimL family protein N-acetyltransferase